MSTSEVLSANSRAASSAALADLVGQQVEVTSIEGQDRYVDAGTLESYVYPWVQLRKKSGEVLCFTVYNIRLIKLFNK